MPPAGPGEVSLMAVSVGSSVSSVVRGLVDIIVSKTVSRNSYFAMCCLRAGVESSWRAGLAGGVQQPGGGGVHHHVAGQPDGVGEAVLVNAGVVARVVQVPDQFLGGDVA